MKQYIKILIWVLLPLCGVACDGPETPQEEADDLNVLIYFAADNNLKSSAIENIDSLLAGYVPTTEGSLLYYLDTGQGAKLIRLNKDKNGVQEQVLKEYGAVNSASAAQLRCVLEDSKAQAPAARYGLVLWSHATGWMPTNSYGQDPVLPVRSGAPSALVAPAPYQAFEYDIYAPQYPRVKSFGEDDGDTTQEIELPDLKAALAGTHYEFIIFDCCLMACVEVVYELKDCCDYILASPTEILADGLHYKSLAGYLFKSRKPDLEAVCKKYYAHYKAQQGFYQSATVSLVKTSALADVATALRPVIEAHRAELDDMAGMNSHQLRGNIQVYDRLSKHIFYDLGHFVSTLAPQEARAFEKALDKAVVYKATTDVFITIPIQHFSGLSVYVPHQSYTRINPAYKNLDWNKAVGLL